MSSTVNAAGEPISTSAVLMAASKHIAVRCRSENVAFINCKKKDPNPEKCLDKGRVVTHCVLNLKNLFHQGQYKHNLFERASSEVSQRDRCLCRLHVLLYQ
ncbi:NADH dehydrogenase [ubiquinone] 1 alpha subcomplex subunit 8-B-like isoform X2 [Phoenix dactylifera]|uniref:NADH dehydrogenase [ubiquinone] 1 alpha subcomplex subunit 8-B-like isoform X2 n=1 Tax=Phoenix dactylifera TaxID=42345 RepID=A0A8B7MTZ2_PHODC|nr:NADH dehydrogenase [ubiquinone] 1 alpha subcomplex subunit 8-B-like isoform X2 [Phoenix dactylifera]